MSVELVFSLKLWRGGSYSFSCILALSTMSGSSGRARQDWDNSDIVDMEIEMLPKSKFADYMAANNLVLRSRVESSFLVIVIIII